MNERKVICPVCGRKVKPLTKCRTCGQDVELAENDLMDVEFLGVDDGYHSWYSPPTSVHERYRCKNRGPACEGCIHNARSDIFCNQGRIDVRRRRRQRYDGTIVYEYKDWIDVG